MNKSKRRIRVLLINAYDMLEAKKQFLAGKWPGHHLFGTLELERTHQMDITIPDHVRFPILNRIGSWIDIPFLDQEIRVLLMLRKCDIIYAPYANSNTKLLILLKSLGLIRKPIVILVHHELFGRPSNNRFKYLLVKKFILNYDFIIFLSSQMKEKLINAYNISAEHVRQRFGHMAWSADVTFYDRYASRRYPETGGHIVTAGNTARDFDLVIRIARLVDFRFKIYCKAASYPSNAGNKPPNVEILSGQFPFDQICRDHENARIVLIPLTPGFEGTAGFTSLLDAMAIGRPVIMTRNNNIDIDFAAGNIGFSLNSNDEHVWAEAINSILFDAERLQQMGSNARRLATERFNINLFAEHLAAVMETVAGRKS